MHCPIRMRFLECPPDLTGSKSYVDEADLFFADPNGWLRSAYPNPESLPSHMVFFDALEQVWLLQSPLNFYEPSLKLL